jgi:hypothetical protein
MKTSKKHVRVSWLAAVAALLLSAGCSAIKATDGGGAPTVPATLSGAQESPPNTSSARGTSMIVIGADGQVTGSVQVTGMTPTVAHIHQGAKGANGPVIIPFTKTGDASFAPPPGARLNDAQLASYQAGDLYVNVHSAAYPGGEVRLQLRPAQ